MKNTTCFSAAAVITLVGIMNANAVFAGPQQRSDGRAACGNAGPNGRDFISVDYEFRPNPGLQNIWWDSTPPGTNYQPVVYPSYPNEVIYPQPQPSTPVVSYVSHRRHHRHGHHQHCHNCGRRMHWCQRCGGYHH